MRPDNTPATQTALAPVPQADINRVIAKVNAMARQIADRDTAQRLSTQGAEPQAGSPAEFARFIGIDTARLKKLIAQAGKFHEDRLQRGHGGGDAGIVGDFAALNRDVEVHADEDALIWVRDRRRAIGPGTTNWPTLAAS